MKTIARIIALFLVSASAAKSAEPVAKQFLRYIYGGDGIELTNICHLSDDAWMLRGARNTNALNALDVLSIGAKPTPVISGTLGTEIYLIEMRDGKVDPAFNLEGVYAMHRQLVLRFVYAALSQKQKMLRQLVTDPGNVKIEGPKQAPPSGDMDQYRSIIELMPVVRSSKPADDAKTKTITYRVPISNEALSLTLVKDGNSWKIDTSKPVQVPLEFFYR